MGIAPSRPFIPAPIPIAGGKLPCSTTSTSSAMAAATIVKIPAIQSTTSSSVSVLHTTSYRSSSTSSIQAPARVTSSSTSSAQLPKATTPTHFYLKSSCDNSCLGHFADDDQIYSNLYSSSNSSFDSFYFSGTTLFDATTSTLCVSSESAGSDTRLQCSNDPDYINGVAVANNWGSSNGVLTLDGSSTWYGCGVLDLADTYEPNGLTYSTADEDASNCRACTFSLVTDVAQCNAGGQYAAVTTSAAYLPAASLATSLPVSSSTSTKRAVSISSIAVKAVVTPVSITSSTKSTSTSSAPARATTPTHFYLKSSCDNSCIGHFADDDQIYSNLYSSSDSSFDSFYFNGTTLFDATTSTICVSSESAGSDTRLQCSNDPDYINGVAVANNWGSSNGVLTLDGSSTWYGCGVLDLADTYEPNGLTYSTVDGDASNCRACTFSLVTDVAQCNAGGQYAAVTTSAAYLPAASLATSLPVSSSTSTTRGVATSSIVIKAVITPVSLASSTKSTSTSSAPAKATTPTHFYLKSSCDNSCLGHFADDDQVYSNLYSSSNSSFDSFYFSGTTLFDATTSTLCVSSENAGSDTRLQCSNDPDYINGVAVANNWGSSNGLLTLDGSSTWYGCGVLDLADMYEPNGLTYSTADVNASNCRACTFSLVTDVAQCNAGGQYAAVTTSAAYLPAAPLATSMPVSSSTSTAPRVATTTIATMAKAAVATTSAAPVVHVASSTIAQAAAAVTPKSCGVGYCKVQWLTQADCYKSDCSWCPWGTTCQQYQSWPWAQSACLPIRP